MVDRIERNKDLVQEIVESTATHVGRIATIITGAVADVAREVGDLFTDGFEMRDAARRARLDEERRGALDTEDRELLDDAGVEDAAVDDADPGQADPALPSAEQRALPGADVAEDGSGAEEASPATASEPTDEQG